MARASVEPGQEVVTLERENFVTALHAIDEIEGSEGDVRAAWVTILKSSLHPTPRPLLRATPQASRVEMYFSAVTGALGPNVLVDLLGEFAQIAGERSQAAREALLRELVATIPETVSPASMQQATREAAHRQKLLQTPTYTYEQLRLVRGDTSVQATRTAVSRLAGRRQLFTVPAGNRHVVIPAFLLTDEGAQRRDLAPLLDPLMAAGLGPWQLWTWLTSPTGFLSGGIPEQLAAYPATAARAATAARRFADQVARPEAESA